MSTGFSILRRSPQRDHRVRATGVPWLRREDYEQAVTLFEDGNTLPKTYEEWVMATEQKIENMKRVGFQVYRAEIDCDRFPVWCEQRGLPLRCAALVRFANIKAAEHFDLEGRN